MGNASVFPPVYISTFFRVPNTAIAYEWGVVSGQLTEILLLVQIVLRLIHKDFPKRQLCSLQVKMV